MKKKISKIRKGIKKNIKIWSLAVHRLGSNKLFPYIFIFCVSFLIFCFIQKPGGFGDPDSFYHLKVGKIIAEKGIILKLPHLQYTYLRDSFTDHHFLYHLLMIPFLVVLGDWLGIMLFTVVLASLLMVGIYAFLKQYKVQYAEIFTLGLFLMPLFVFRMSLAKAPAFSLIILLLGVYLILQKRLLLLSLVSFFYVWSYGGFPLLFIMAIFFAAAQGIDNVIKNTKTIGKANIVYLPILKYFITPFFSKQNFKLYFSVLVGLTVGLVVNPYFPNNLYFYWTQIVKIGVFNYSHMLRVGTEWYPYAFSEMIAHNVFVFILLLLAFICMFLNIKKLEIKDWFFFICTLFFFVITLKSKRYIEYMVPFAWIYSIFVINTSLGKKDMFKELEKIIYSFKYKLLVYLFIIYFVFFVVFFGYFQLKSVYSFMGDFPWKQYEQSIGWINDNVEPGKLIFHSDWDFFPMLFYYSDDHRYLVGLDPTFMFDYNQQKYKVWNDITLGYQTDQIYESIKNVFGADYVIVDINDQKKFDKNIQKDNRFKLMNQDNGVKVYYIDG